MPLPSPTSRFGLSVALTTPFRADGAIDLPRLTAHARWCLDHGCDGITLFGTTGEGASIGLGERRRALYALARADIDLPARVLAGVTASAGADAQDQARAALDLGVHGLLLAPPYYFKDPGEDGLFAWFADVIDGLGTAGRNIVLYNIPQVTAVRLSVELIERLKTAFPDVVTGVKDSSGDWPYSESLLRAHGELAILIGDERSLARGMRHGAKGTICGVANVWPQAIAALIETGEDDPRVMRLIEKVLSFPVTPAIKALMAHHTRDPRWLAVRPPLTALDPGAAAELGRTLDQLQSAEVA